MLPRHSRAIGKRPSQSPDASIRIVDFSASHLRVFLRGSDGSIAAFSGFAMAVANAHELRR
jgi:uncharacterized heparinase superfamily protein